ncbi:MAG: tyrosine-type recombinase/integrase [Actinomycetota bacterium]|nr:tyrosine-type recombinase/integrase [Actinomycetota bacterium]
MSELEEALRGYLQVRRSLGYKLVRTEKLCAQFIAYLAERGIDEIRSDDAIAWALLPVGGSQGWYHMRLSAIRGFAAWAKAMGSPAEVPPAGVIRAKTQRLVPYPYSEADLAKIMAGVSILRGELRQATYRTLVGLLWVTGMRVGEAIAAEVADFVAGEGILIIHHAKLDKSRELPLHPTSTLALSDYLKLRQRLLGAPASRALFISPAGTRLLYCNVQNTFSRVLVAAGVGPISERCRPRLHDLRHRFAVDTLADAYRQGADPQHRLALLSTYLGHVNPGATYWYLSGTPELLSLAAARLELSRGGGR